MPPAQKPTGAEGAERALPREQPVTAAAATPTPVNNESAGAEGAEFIAQDLPGSCKIPRDTMIYWLVSPLTSAPRPWHARTFADATVQRLSVALQRGVQEDQLLRAHVRRTRHLFGVNDGGAPGGGAATESVVARAGAARRAECRCT